MRARTKALLPWILSLGIVAFLFFTTDIEAVGRALESADWTRLIAFMALVTLISFVADSATLVPLFHRFVAPIGFREIVSIKGVSYFLNALNYSLAAGGMAWLVHKRRGVPFMRALSSLIWFFFVDIIALGLMLTLGWVFGRHLMSGADFIDRVPIVIAVVASVVVGALVYWNLRFDFFFFGFFRKWSIFQCFQEARGADYIRMVAFRATFVLVYVLMHFLLLPSFGVHIPFETLLMYSPLITFVQVIPATVSGLGAAQGVMVALFASHVPPGHGDARAVIVAYSTVIGPLMMLMRLVIGYCFVATIARDVLPTADIIEAERTRDADPHPESPIGQPGPAGSSAAPSPGAQGVVEPVGAVTKAVGTSDT